MPDYEDLMRLVALSSLLGLALVACGAPQDASETLTSPRDRSRDSFPLGPEESVTPGETCQHPDSHRYPENIAYCTRNVSTSTKNQIIRDYDRQFNYTIGSMPRSEFKIDHYIPLCMGGANSVTNLWPQHKSVYDITDPFEPKLCQLMAEGKLQQAEAIRMIKRVKNDLDAAPEMMRDVDARLGH
jgi:hypothetical protein